MINMVIMLAYGLMVNFHCADNALSLLSYFPSFHSAQWKCPAICLTRDTSGCYVLFIAVVHW